MIFTSYRTLDSTEVQYLVLPERWSGFQEDCDTVFRLISNMNFTAEELLQLSIFLSGAALIESGLPVELFECELRSRLMHRLKEKEREGLMQA